MSNGNKYRKTYLSGFDLELISQLLEEEAKRILLRAGISPWKRDPGEIEQLGYMEKAYLYKLSTTYTKLQRDREQRTKSLPWPLRWDNRPEDVRCVPLPDEFYDQEGTEEA